MPRRRWIPVLLTVLLCTALSGLLPAVSAQGSQQPTALDMLAALNQWRLEEDLAPFRPNHTLEALAMLQARYLLTLPDLPENVHTGITGEGPRDRALWPPYQWPYYDIPARLDLVEIIVAEQTVQQGIDWWKHSPIHRQAATNPNYREAGVVALPHPIYGMLFVAVLGGRPDVFPALIYPDRSTLYLTRETFWGARGDSYLVSITRVRLLDSDQTPLTDWLPWQPTLPMPTVSGDRLYVEYSDGQKTVTTEVNVQQDVFPLPAYVGELAAVMPSPSGDLALTASQVAEGPPIGRADVQLMVSGPDWLLLHIDAEQAIYLSDFQIFALLPDDLPRVVVFSGVFGNVRYAGPHTCYVFAAEGTSFEPPPVCTGLVVLQQVPADAVFWYDRAQEQPVGMFVLSGSGLLLADCTAMNAACAFYVAAAPLPAGLGGTTATPISKKVHLVYDQNSLAVINDGGQNLNLLGLSLTDGTTTLSARQWARAGMAVSLESFPPDDCLQVWSYGLRDLPKPTACHVRQAWITVRPQEVFWTAGEFRVLYNGAVLATCQAAAGDCLFELR